MEMEESNKQIFIQVEKPNYTDAMKKQFGHLGLGSFLYACFYALCMYKNTSGITYPFFLLGSLWFCCFCFKELGISLKKESIFFICSILLLGISTFLTADGRIIFMNKTAIFVLIICFLLHHFYQDAHWSFFRYLLYLFVTPFAWIGEIARPIQDMEVFITENNKKEKGNVFYVVLGLSCCIPIFIFIWFLLMSADQVFGNMFKELFLHLKLSNLIGIFTTVVLTFFITYCIMAFLCKKAFSVEYRERTKTEAILAITIALPLTVMYALFSGIQIVCLFMQKIDLEKISYAEYARQGFFQLLVVCIINLILVLVGNAYFKESTLLKILLTVMSLCTYIMIISAGYRMILYIQNYYVTFLRLFVLWFLVILFLLITGSIISVCNQKFPLVRYSMVVVVICYLALSFSHPDYWIAKCNVHHMEQYTTNGFFDKEYYDDYRYLANLSMDAAPALQNALKGKGFDLETVIISLQDENNRQTLSNYYGGYAGDKNSWGYYYLHKMYVETEDLGIRNFNVSRYIAQNILHNY